MNQNGYIGVYRLNIKSSVFCQSVRVRFEVKILGLTLNFKF